MQSFKLNNQKSTQKVRDRNTPDSDYLTISKQQITIYTIQTPHQFLSQLKSKVQDNQWNNKLSKQTNDEEYYYYQATI